MPISLFFGLISLVVLLLLSAFFSGSETALMSLNRIRIKNMAEKGDKNAGIVEELLKHPNRLLATILVGNNIVNIAAAAIATSLAIKVFSNWGIGIATGTITLLVLVFGEMTPKSIAAGKAERISLLIARPIRLLVGLLYPVVRALVFITTPLVKRLGGEPRFSMLLTEEEIKMMVSVGEEEGVIETEEKEMIHGIFEFGDTEAKEIMAPRIDIVGINTDASLEEAQDLVLQSGHSKIPTYEETIDNIIGIVHARDLLRALKDKKQLKDIMRPAYYVPETKKLDELLSELKERKTQLAIVVDEYGGTAGLVTVEDIVEEIVGEIMDEYDVEEIPVQKLDENTAIIDAKLNLKDLNEALEMALSEEEFDTVGGLIFNVLGKIPAVGEKIVIDGVVLSVERMRGRRITKVKVVKKTQEKQEETT
ncbi:MAG: hemolysin family protein [Candidatus Hydrothermarchaeales archaeon]